MGRVAVVVLDLRFGGPKSCGRCGRFMREWQRGTRGFVASKEEEGNGRGLGQPATSLSPTQKRKQKQRAPSPTGRGRNGGRRSKAPTPRTSAFPTSPGATVPMPPPPATEPGEFRDWANLPELPLAEVLQGLVPCLHSLLAFAATCRPWRRLLRASAADLVRPRLPPLLLLCRRPFRVIPFSPLVAPQPVPYRALVPRGTTLLSASRGHLILLTGRLHLVDALTGDERRTLQLPSPHIAYHYAALTPSHLLLFHSKYVFFSLPFPEHPSPNDRLDWTKHSILRAASFVTAVLEFRGRVLGLTHRAQLLEFHLNAVPPKQSVQMLPTAGLPAATTFDRWHFGDFGPQLVAAGDRVLLVLFMLRPNLSLASWGSQLGRVKKVSVYGLDMAQMRWEEVDNIGAYSLFLDCSGRSTAACVDGGSCGVEQNRVYISWCSTWRVFPPGWEEPIVGEADGLGGRLMVPVHELWPSMILFYPRLFF